MTNLEIVKLGIKKTGSQVNLAKTIKVTTKSIQNWLTGKTRIKKESLDAIKKIIEG